MALYTSDWISVRNGESQTVGVEDLHKLKNDEVEVRFRGDKSSKTHRDERTMTHSSTAYFQDAEKYEAGATMWTGSKTTQVPTISDMEEKSGLDYDYENKYRSLSNADTPYEDQVWRIHFTTDNGSDSVLLGDSQSTEPGTTKNMVATRPDFSYLTIEKVTVEKPGSAHNDGYVTFTASVVGERYYTTSSVSYRPEIFFNNQEVEWYGSYDDNDVTSWKSFSGFSESNNEFSFDIDDEGTGEFQYRYSYNPAPTPIGYYESDDAEEGTQLLPLIATDDSLASYSNVRAGLMSGEVTACDLVDTDHPDATNIRVGLPNGKIVAWRRDLFN